MRFSPACNCCGSCTGTVTASSSCNGTTISGATYKLVASDGVTVVATLTGGTSVTFSSVAGGSSYYVEVSKTGYHTKRSTLFSVSCGGTPSITVSTWPTTYNLTINVKIQICDLSGATVAVTGDSTGSGSTDGSGNVTLSLSSSSSSETQSLSYTVTPPSGHGAAVRTGSWSIHACSPTTQNVGVLPSTGHVAVVCNRRYMPEELEATSDYGACAVVFNNDPGFPMWTGTFTYTSSSCIIEHECTPPFTGLYPDQTDDVTVAVGLIARPGDSDCDETTFDVFRIVCLAETLNCPTLVEPVAVTRCQPVGDSASCDPDWFDTLNCACPPEADYVGEGLDQLYSCPSSIEITFDISAKTATACATYEETEDTITFTGTIT